MSRADTRTRREATEELYSDFDSSFDKNPVTGALARVVNDDAVKQSLRNLILTMRGEWAHHPFLGSKVYGALFEPVDSLTAALIRDAVVSAVRYEPRATYHRIDVVENRERDGYDVRIVFTTINATTPVTFSEFLRRIR